MNRTSVILTLFGALTIVLTSAIAGGTPLPTATPDPTVCFAPNPSSVAPGEEVEVSGDCPGLLHHRFIRIYFNGVIVAEWDFGGGRLFSTRFVVPRTTRPGGYNLRLVGPFIDTSTELRVIGQPLPCAGDCNLDDRVTIDELVTGTNIAIGRKSIEACTALDGDADLRISIEELVSGVGAAMNGCAVTVSGPQSR